jgi:hypothetical protein
MRINRKLVALLALVVLAAAPAIAMAEAAPPTTPVSAQDIVAGHR